MPANGRQDLIRRLKVKAQWLLLVCLIERFSTLEKLRIYFSKNLCLSYYSQNKQLLLLHTHTISLLGFLMGLQCFS